VEKIVDEVKGYGINLNKGDIDKSKEEFDKMMSQKQ